MSRPECPAGICDGSPDPCLFCKPADWTPPAEPVPVPLGGTCPCCKQRVRPLNPHRMDLQKWEVLCVLADFARGGYAWVKVGHGSELYGAYESTSGWVPHASSRVRTAYRAEAHVGRLKWFGLVEHKGRRTGLYKISPAGLEFLAGKRSVPAVIWCRDGEVLERSSDLVFVSDVKDVILDRAYWDSYSSVQRRVS